MMRPLLTVFAALLLAGAAAAATAAPLSPTAVFVLTGGGWGHGVGLSQWGAYGQAKAGRDYRTILSTYYTGVDFGQAPTKTLAKLRVLVGDGLGSVTVSSTRPYTVEDATGSTFELPAGPVSLRPALKLPVGDGGKPVALQGPLLFKPRKDALLALEDKTYRGQLRVAVSGGKLQLADVVGLEAYLLGVVPGEMPKDWPLEALKAQAVAARTYAIANLGKGKPYDLYSDYRSQVYDGVGSEAASTTEAVRETSGQILTFAGRAAQTLYFSSSGGRTASALDVFGNDIPYLVAVADPWDETSPNHAWVPQLLGGAELGKRLGLSAAVADASIVPGTQGHPAALRFVTDAGGSSDVRLSEVRARLGLRSTTFRLGVLRFVTPPGTIKAGTKLKLSGVARDVADAILEKQRPDGSWAPAAKLVFAADGSFAVILQPTTTSIYRLSTGGLAGPTLTVRVAGTTA